MERLSNSQNERSVRNTDAFQTEETEVEPIRNNQKTKAFSNKNFSDEEKSFKNEDLDPLKNDEKVLNEQCRKMRILILSESGAGKSSWINGAINYLSLINEEFSDLDKTSTFPVMGDKINLSSQFIVNANESRKDQEKGQPSKNECKKWKFVYKSYAISLIDTPTFCGKSGVEHNQKIFKKILDTLSSFKQINSICIFLKTNSSQLITKLKDIISEMSSILQNDFTKNIVFCFTNTRGNLYQPGNTMKGLKDVLNTLQMNIPLNRGVVYCFDNEWFKFLAAARNKNTQEKIPKEYESSYLLSLKKSVIEADRLFKNISEMQPFLTQYTLNPNDLSYVSKDLSCNIERNSAAPMHLAKSKVGMSAAHSRLGNRGFLSICCPNKYCAQTQKPSGFLKTATYAKHQWFCPNCNGKIQYGFDGKFYCLCGCASVDAYKFKCPYSEQNKYEELYNLDELLKKVDPFKEINILILSESGVEKSAWINGFVNYLTFSSIKAAELGSLYNVKPFSFNLTDEEANEITVNIQTETNKNLRTEQSSYQEFKSYSFPYDGYLINLIDAPKFFDEQGFKQKQYITSIRKILQTLMKVNGICFLMKPKLSNLTNEVNNIVMELQVALSQDLCKNIMFCFTNLRTSFYRLEHYVEILKDKFSKYPAINISIEKSIVYGFENEAYKLLAAMKNVKQPFQFPIEEKASFTLSWEMSVTETRRMVEYVSALKPYEFNFLKFTALATFNVFKLNLNKVLSITKNSKSKEAAGNEEKVNNPGQGNFESRKEFVSSKNAVKVIEMITETKYPKEITILLISESGEGKSAWIDGMKYYFQSTSSEYTKSSSDCIINHIIETSLSNGKEIDINHMSQTQKIKVYFFNNDSWSIQLIYTPASFYKRKVEQPKIFIENIFKLATYRKINSICFLLKSKRSNLITEVKPIIEVFKTLQQNISKNITFCFTETYWHRASMDALKKINSENSQSNLELINNLYWFDGDASSYHHATENMVHPEQYQPERKTINKERWSISVQEAQKMFKHISEMQPFTFKSTTNENTLIHSSSTLTNDSCNENTDWIGDDFKKIQASGQSLTQIMKTHSYPFQRFFITLITTLGCGELRGLDQAKVNFEKIFNLLSTFKEFNPICTLLKPNNRRIDIMFRIRLKELVYHKRKKKKGAVNNDMKPFTLNHFARSKFKMLTPDSRPDKIAYLFIDCQYKECFSSTEVQWFCPKCNTKILYGFNNLFYCDCGCASVDTYEFKCLGNGRNQEYKQYINLNEFISKLVQLKKMNILIIGETGVGKSTWVNGLRNFSAYSSLEEAESNVLLTLIHSKFTLTDNNSNEITVWTGDDSNEIQSSGQSSTQLCKKHSFPFESYYITLIDTPGYGDVRGLDQDKVNFENIFNMLSIFKELSAICILLKPNNRRLDITFRFCLKELLTYFHRDASSIILFCFTNSRGTLYRPGDTLPTLRNFLSDSLQGLIKLDEKTMYCFDSEPYRYLAAIRNKNQPVQFPEEEKTIYSESWMKSIKETKRIINHISKIVPHQLQKTVELIRFKHELLTLNRRILQVQTRRENINKDDTFTETSQNYKEEISCKKLKNERFDKILEEAAIAEKKISSFLRNNALAIYNDEKIELLDQLIREEKEETEGEENNNNLCNLLKQLNSAERELSDLRKIKTKHEQEENISSTDVDCVINNFKSIFENQF